MVMEWISLGKDEGMEYLGNDKLGGSREEMMVLRQRDAVSEAHGIALRSLRLKSCRSRSYASIIVRCVEATRRHAISSISNTRQKCAILALCAQGGTNSKSRGHREG